MKRFRTTAIGSFPKPNYLIRTRKQFAAGEVNEEHLRMAERNATKMWIEFQNELEIDEVVHGEMERGDMIAYFAERLGGFKLSELVESFSNYAYHRLICIGEIKPRVEPGFTVAAWQEAQAISNKPVKGMLTDPFTIAAWSWNEHYVALDSDGFFRERRVDFVRALIPFIRDEARALQAAGAEIIQIDCPGIATWPDEFDLLLESMRAITEKLSTKIVCHICFADYEKLYPRLLELPVHQFLLELSGEADISQHGIVHPYGAFDYFSKHKFNKELGLGVVYVHDNAVPSVEDTKKIIERALAVDVPSDKIVLTPDCGLKTRTVEVAKAMMSRIAEAAR